jgi:hypothetical protein
MKSKKTRSPRGKSFLPPLFGLMVLGPTAEAQQQIVQPQLPPVESITQLHMTNDFQVFGPRPLATPPGPYEPFHWDQFVVRPHVDYQFIDALGLLAAPSNHVNTLIQDISPGVLINLGPHWSVDYTATIGLYSNTNFGTEVDHNINLTGQTVYNNWIFGFQQSVLLTKSALIETGGQTDEQTYNTAVTGHHEDSQYFSEDLALSQNIQQTSGGFENMYSWSTVDWLNYQPQSRFNIGIGPGLGYNHADFGPDSVFEQGQARLNWRVRDKLSIQLSGGFQETEFLGGQGAPDLFSPIYGGSIQYQLFDPTQISIYFNRVVSPSLFVGEYTEDTVIGCSISQRFFKQFFLNVSGAYNNQQYVASSADVSAARTDKFYSVDVRLSHAVLERGTLSIFYQYGRDNSTVGGYSFISNQYGIEANYSF